ncbi:MAG: S8 family serine peptidase [Acidobacteriota bacterium]
MKPTILRAFVILALLVFISALGAMPTLSRADRNQKEKLTVSIEKKSSAARRRPAPLSYRSTGGFHKFSVSDPELAAKIISQGNARRSQRFDSYTLIEVSEAALTSLEAGELARAEMRDDWNLILLRAGQIDTTAPRPPVPESLRHRESDSPALHLIQLFGPPTPTDIAALKSTGAKLISYIPNNAYLIRAAPAEIKKLRAARMQQLIQWDEPLHPAFKLDPRIALRSLQLVPVSIALVDSAESQSSIERIKSLSLKILMPEFQAANAIHIKALLPAAQLTEIARMDEVMLIEPSPRVSLHDERANQIVAGDIEQETINNLVVSRPARPGYASFLNLHGFTSSFDFAIDFADTGLDSGTDDPSRIHRDFLDSQGRSRIAYLYDYTQDELLHTSPVLPWHDPTGHGTIDASIAAGAGAGQFADSLGFQFGQGVAPFARLGISKIFNDNGEFTNIVSIPVIVASAYRAGARISTNSWGTCDLTFGFCNLYGTNSSIYDSLVRDADSVMSGNQGMTILFSAGNNGGDDPTSIGIPGTAKNVITVGASEGFRAKNESGNDLTDGCNVGPAGADNALDIPLFSSSGPVQDGRAKPDLVAPGTHITGAASQDSFYAAAPDDEVAVCDKYFPSGQTLYALSSGTSHSTPLVAGGAALAYQWLRERLNREPSPAMVKALILNSTSYLNGARGGDSLPGAHQGWGLLNLSRMFEETDRILYDQPEQAIFTESGGAQFEITGFISDPAKEFRVMLVWSDAPAVGLANATLVNQLNLEVIVGGTLYNGNHFSGQYTVAGGGKDVLNNVQGVRLPAGVTGPFVIRIRPTVIAGDGVPGNGADTDQDFALVVANGREAPAPALAITESDGLSQVEVRHANDVRDASLIPGENAFVTITLTNQSSSAAMSASTASLSIEGGVTALSTFPAIAARSSGINEQPFQVFVPSDLRCGSVAEFRLRVTGEAGTFTLPVRVRVGRASAQEIFVDDDVDSMRVKWKAKKGFRVATGVGTSGVLSYHAVDPGKEDDDSQLSDLKMKKKISIPSNAGQIRLSFFHIFNFEPGFDGGVLEISVDGGATWEDLGSRIIAGGYDGKVTSASGNPLGDRLAWTSRGRAGVFSQVVINLDEFAGRRIQLRFRAGFDGATGVRDGFTGWFIDDIRLTATSFACR